MNQRLFRIPALLLLVFCGFPVFAEKSVSPSYRVTESVRDSSLSEKEAVFILNFSALSMPTVGDIRLSYNGTEQTVQPGKDGKFRLKLKPGKWRFQFFYGSYFYEITTDSIAIEPGYRSTMEIVFKRTDVIEVCKKPVIYLYPQHTMPVAITLDLQGHLGFTYPAYNKGWNVTADPDGTLHQGTQQYHYLFWEGTTSFSAADQKANEGFVVSRDSLVPFFERSLSVMGLQANEIEDYITYWVPLMQANEKNYVHFLFNEEFGKYAALNITPKPDHLFRVFMLWSGLDGDHQPTISPQKLQQFHREGFTVVEWGGAEVKNLPVNDSTIR